MTHLMALSNKVLTSEQKKKLQSILALQRSQAIAEIKKLSNENIVFFSIHVPEESNEDFDLKNRFKTVCESEVLSAHWLAKAQEFGINFSQKDVSNYLLFLGVCSTTFATKTFSKEKHPKELLEWLTAIHEQFHGFHAAMLLMESNPTSSDEFQQSHISCLVSDCQQYHSVAGEVLFIIMLALRFPSDSDLLFPLIKGALTRVDQQLRENEEAVKNTLANCFANLEPDEPAEAARYSGKEKFFRALSHFWSERCDDRDIEQLKNQWRALQQSARTSTQQTCHTAAGNHLSHPPPGPAC